MSFTSKIESFYLIPAMEVADYCDSKEFSLSEDIKTRAYFLAQALTSAIAVPIILFVGTLEIAGYLFFNWGDKDCFFEMITSLGISLVSILVSIGGIALPQIASIPFNVYRDLETAL